MAFLGRILGNYADQSFENMVPSGTSATALPRKAYQWTLGLEIYPPEGSNQSDDPKAGEEETSLWENAKAWGEEAMFGADPPDPNKFQDVGYEVHLNFSPIIVYDGWLDDYEELFTLINNNISLYKKLQVSAFAVLPNETRFHTLSCP